MTEVSIEVDIGLEIEELVVVGVVDGVVELVELLGGVFVVVGGFGVVVVVVVGLGFGVVVVAVVGDGFGVVVMPITIGEAGVVA